MLGSDPTYGSVKNSILSTCLVCIKVFMSLVPPCSILYSKSVYST